MKKKEKEKRQKAADLTPEDALAICRTPKPAPGKIKKVLAWANRNPAPDKVPALLLLQTGNWANRKDLAAEFQEALQACAATDSSALWRTVEGDWETTRVWHALQALAATESEDDLHRMLECARQPLHSLHWSIIADALAAAGIAVPADVAELQAECKRDPRRVDEHFEQREADWPMNLDPPTRPTGKSRPGSRPAQVPVAPFLATEADPPFLARFRNSLAHRFRPTRMEELFQAAELAWYLTALDRVDEAESVLRHVTSSVTFSGNYNVWTPTACCWVLQARSGRLRQKTRERDAALKVLRDTPAQVYDPSRAAQEAVLVKLHGQLREARDETGRKWACHIAARIVLTTAAFYRETACPGFAHEGTCPVADFEELIQETLGFVAERIR